MSKLVSLGEGHLRHTVSEYVEHYHGERNHQGMGNRLLMSAARATRPANGNEPINFYYRRAA